MEIISELRRCKIQRRTQKFPNKGAISNSSPKDRNYMENFNFFFSIKSFLHKILSLNKEDSVHLASLFSSIKKKTLQEFEI